jgi:hypothetical protein
MGCCYENESWMEMALNGTMTDFYISSACKIPVPSKTGLEIY